MDEVGERADLHEWRAPFRANVTAKTNSAGTWKYAWTEQSHDTTTGATTDASPSRSGDATNNWALELNNREVTVNTVVQMRFRGVVLGQDVYEFAAPDGAVVGGGGSGTLGGAKVTRDTNQTIANDTPTFIEFSDEVYDTDGYWAIGNPGRFTVPASGIYLVGGTVQWADNNGPVRELGIAVNSALDAPLASTIANPHDVPASASNVITQTINCVLTLSALDTVHLEVEQISGGAIDVAVGYVAPAFWIERLR